MKAILLKNLKLVVAVCTAAAILLVLAGFLVPLGSYVTAKGICGNQHESSSVQRLHLIRGDSLEKVKSADIEPGPAEGCKPLVVYYLYFF